MHTPLEWPYLTKLFRPPKFIISPEGICDTELVASTLLEHGFPRCEHLLSSLRSDPAFTGIPERLEEASIQEAKKISSPLAAAGAGGAGAKSTIIPLISDVWNGSEPINYHAQITLGTPSHPIYVDLDTGSSLLWVQSLLSPADTPPQNQPIYTPHLSRTSKDLAQTTVVTYGDGSSLLAHLYQDTVTLGEVSATSALLGAAPTHLLRRGLLGSKSGGLFGLSLSPRNLVKTLRSQGAIASATISLVGPRNDPKLAREIDRNRTLAPRGQLVLGDLDRSFYTGEIAWCDLAAVAAGDRWIVPLDAVRVNGATILTSQYALIDTGTAYIVTSPAVYSHVKACIPGAEDINHPSSTSTQMFSFPASSLQSIEFVFASRALAMKKQDFSLGGIRDEKTGRMASSIVSIPGDRGLEMFSDMQNLWVIGGIFLDNFVTVFDFEKRKVGFATIAEEEAAT
ncbi:aspartic peptidase domain-containing protein [Sphaerosporella brunnea]|uniref:Aspartic peptidase domain-containing protein n=1 Tax=Sphaerosporella brunnea TaxID=1250544 RepID=A0A5J5F9M5_9PEZI|nr:aspartic peptidase domain-containing protein [Sphaerosporella brunnea]